MKLAFALAVSCFLLGSGTASTASASAETNRVSVKYLLPKKLVHQQVYKWLKEQQLLEKLQNVLSPFRLPKTLTVTLTGCNDEADAFYEDDAITICYEYVGELWENLPSKKTAAGVAPIDTVVGPIVDTFLHEFAHALFDMLDLPVFGREEDAADQVAAYIYLHFGDTEARRLIMGTADAYMEEVQDTDGPPKMSDLADEHETDAQRYYNLLCIAYGAHAKLFRDVLTKKYLPKERAEVCGEEYEQVHDAFEKLIRPHIDPHLAEKMMDGSWLPKTSARLQRRRNKPH